MQLLLQGMLKGTGHFQDARRKEVKKKKKSSLFLSCGSESQVPLIEPEPNFYQVAGVPPSEKLSVRGLGLGLLESRD